ncbi:MAG: hypothetical protein V3T77_06105 [Planctomycetota bacterium]
MTYKICYHIGDTMNLKSKGHPGILTLLGDGLLGDGLLVDGFKIDGEPSIQISFKDVINAVDVHRVHFLCSMLRINHRGGKLFLTTPFISFMGVPFVTNFPMQNQLQRELDTRIRSAWLVKTA